jgi:hypothetical protein
VPTERLGVRVSILERVASVGGAAVIDTALGEGTVVALHWPVRTASATEAAATRGRAS